MSTMSAMNQRKSFDDDDLDLSRVDIHERLRSDFIGKPSDDEFLSDDSAGSQNFLEAISKRSCDLDSGVKIDSSCFKNSMVDEDLPLAPSPPFNYPPSKEKLFQSAYDLLGKDESSSSPPFGDPPSKTKLLNSALKLIEDQNSNKLQDIVDERIDVVLNNISASCQRHDTVSSIELDDGQLIYDESDKEISFRMVDEIEKASVAKMAVNCDCRPISNSTSDETASQSAKVKKKTDRLNANISPISPILSSTKDVEVIKCRTKSRDRNQQKKSVDINTSINQEQDIDALVRYINGEKSKTDKGSSSTARTKITDKPDKQHGGFGKKKPGCVVNSDNQKAICDESKIVSLEKPVAFLDIGTSSREANFLSKSSVPALKPTPNSISFESKVNCNGSVFSDDEFIAVSHKKKKLLKSKEKEIVSKKFDSFCSDRVGCKASNLEKMPSKQFRNIASDSNIVFSPSCVPTGAESGISLYAFDARNRGANGRRNSTGNSSSEFVDDSSDLESVKSLPVTEQLGCVYKSAVTYASVAAPTDRCAPGCHPFKAKRLNVAVDFDTANKKPSFPNKTTDITEVKGKFSASDNANHCTSKFNQVVCTNLAKNESLPENQSIACGESTNNHGILSTESSNLVQSDSKSPPIGFGYQPNSLISSNIVEKTTDLVSDKNANLVEPVSQSSRLDNSAYVFFDTRRDRPNGQINFGISFGFDVCDDFDLKSKRNEISKSSATSQESVKVSKSLSNFKQSSTPCSSASSINEIMRKGIDNSISFFATPCSSDYISNDNKPVTAFRISTPEEFLKGSAQQQANENHLNSNELHPTGIQGIVDNELKFVETKAGCQLGLPRKELYLEPATGNRSLSPSGDIKSSPAFVDMSRSMKEVCCPEPSQFDLLGAQKFLHRVYNQVLSKDDVVFYNSSNNKVNNINHSA